ncbi:tyrosine-type recombinase/integrase [Desulfonatronum parangueonense]
MSKRHKTQYAGVYYVEVPRLGGPGTEKSFIVSYRDKSGKQIEARVGRQYRDGMNPKQASIERGKLIEGKTLAPKQEREKRIAEEEAIRIASEAEKNRPTMARLWEEFYTAKSDRKSLNSEVGRWNLHLAPFLADKMPNELLTLDIQRINMSMRNKGLFPQTRKHVLVLLKRIINYAVDMGRIDPPYSAKFKIDVKTEIGKIDNETTEDLTPDQLRQFLDVVQNAPDTDRQGSDVMRLALATGMRKSELFKLRWDDINFDKQHIRITGPKGGKTETIPLNSTARAIFESIQRVQIVEDGCQVYSPWVFPGRNPLNHVSCLKRQVQNIRKAAQLPEGFRPLHGLRHTFACALISSGKVDLATLQKLLTHKSPQMTLRYAKVRCERLSNASSVMDDILTNAQTSEELSKVTSLDEARRFAG